MHDASSQDLQLGTRTPPPSPAGPPPLLQVVRVPRWPRWPRWAVALVLVWLGLGYVGDLLARSYQTPTLSCAFKGITSRPCPTCGSGRGSLALLHGDVGAAFAFNPLFFSLLGLGALLLTGRLIFGRALKLSLSPWGRRVAWAVALLVVAANWAYLIAARI